MSGYIAHVDDGGIISREMVCPGDDQGSPFTNTVVGGRCVRSDTCLVFASYLFYVNVIISVDEERLSWEVFDDQDGMAR